MDNERLKNDKNNWLQVTQKRRGNVWTGLFLLVIGVLLMAKTAGIYFPDWFFTWPMILITLGLFIGLRHGFKRGGWIVPIIVGGVFLAERLSDDLELRPYLWPILLIGGGLFILLGGGNNWRRKRHDADLDQQTFYNNALAGTTHVPGLEQDYSETGEIIDITAIFSGVKKKVVSKNVQVIDLVAVMGGAEVNMINADFKGRIIIDSFTMFGGIKLIVPPHWDVQSQVVAIFGGVDDKRPPAAQHDPTKVIVLDGTCLFGGIEIKSY